jgi:hypothetical protein
MLVATMSDKKSFRRYDRTFFRDIVDDIFATSDRGKAEQLVEHYDRYWMSIIGTRGAVGKKTVNSSTILNSLIEFDAPPEVEVHRDDSGLDDTKLDSLEVDI